MRFRIGYYESTPIFDSGTDFPTISAKMASIINFHRFPPVNEADAPPGGRLLPLSLPGLGTFPVPFYFGAKMRQL
jgi:hypothetical protein